MAFNQLTDEQIDDEILRMAIEESTNMTDNNNDINGDEDDEILRMAIEESTNMTDNNNDDDEILHTVLEESKKSIISENFVDIIKKNDKFLSETINRFNKLQNIENIEIEKKDIEKKDIEKIENTPLTLEQLREKRLKRFLK